MPEKIEFIIEGDPMGKQSVRTTRSGHSYIPKQTKDYMARIVEAFRTAYPDFVRWEKGVPLRFRVRAYYKIPASASKKQRQMMLDDVIKPTVKPDYDNVAKIFDALTGIAWYDDAQITNGGVIKRYSEYPRVEVSITEDK